MDKLEGLVSRFNEIVKELHRARTPAEQIAPSALVDAAVAFAEADEPFRDDMKVWDQMNADERARWSHRCALGRELELIAVSIYGTPRARVPDYSTADTTRYPQEF